MRIGIIGSGSVGSSLANGLARHGHDVMLGTRSTEKPAVQEFLSASEGRGRAGDYAETARFGDIIITAFPGSLVPETLAAMGPENLAGKIIIDAVNPIARVDGEAVAAYGDDDSAAEVLQRAVPSARVVKAYNTIAASRMVDPDPAGGPTTMRIAGDDADSKAEVTALLASTGWKVRDLGGLDQSRRLEAEVVAWVRRMDSERAAE
jgi:8-hydroxy-5-deazaflavin:NADPH oxidoreductase